MTSAIRAHVWISGRVQGVAFRWETARVAERHAVGGWVRNLPDGRVEAVFEGPREAVEAVVDWCRQGPALARVDDLLLHGEPPTGRERRFQITR
jgi:acylphosphatase